PPDQGDHALGQPSARTQDPGRSGEATADELAEGPRARRRARGAAPAAACRARAGATALAAAAGGGGWGGGRAGGTAGGVGEYGGAGAECRRGEPPPDRTPGHGGGHGRGAGARPRATGCECGQSWIRYRI